jgi:hypothetical protein
MSAALVQKTPNATAPSMAQAVTSRATGAFPGSVTVGNIVIAYCIQFRGAGSVSTPTFSDNAGNTWYTDKVLAISSVASVAIGHCYPAGAVALNITASVANASNICVGAAEFSGIATGLTAGASANNSNTNTGTTITTGALGSGNNLYIGACLWDASAGSISCTPAQTQIHENENSIQMVMNAEYQIDTGSQNLGWTLASSKLWAACGVAYAEAGGSTYNDSIAESASISDSSSSVATFNSGMSESIVITDSSGSIAELLGQILESNSISDIILNNAIYLSNISEINNISDEYNNLAEFLSNISEIVNVHDNIPNIANLLSNVSEVSSISDLVNTGNIFLESINESVAISDLITLMGAIAKYISATMTIKNKIQASAEIKGIVSGDLKATGKIRGILQ